MPWLSFLLLLAIAVSACIFLVVAVELAYRDRRRPQSDGGFRVERE